MEKNDLIIFKKNELKGSRLKCLLMTTGSKKQVVERINSLIKFYNNIIVEDNDIWMPAGLVNPDEARLGEENIFKKKYNLDNIKSWWLKVIKKSNTPNWDVVSSCKINGDKGLILIEAKSHEKELNREDACKSKNPENIKQINNAISIANNSLKILNSGWNLSIKFKYQLSNRFAWSWKLASMGIPIILIYLGFLNDYEMDKNNDRCFKSQNEWERVLKKYSNGIIPEDAWGNWQKLNNSAGFLPIIQSYKINY